MKDQEFQIPFIEEVRKVLLKNNWEEFPFGFEAGNLQIKYFSDYETWSLCLYRGWEYPTMRITDIDPTEEDWYKIMQPYASKYYLSKE